MGRHSVYQNAHNWALILEFSPKPVPVKPKQHLRLDSNEQKPYKMTPQLLYLHHPCDSRHKDDEGTGMERYLNLRVPKIRGLHFHVILPVVILREINHHVHGIFL